MISTQLLPRVTPNSEARPADMRFATAVAAVPSRRQGPATVTICRRAHIKCRALVDIAIKTVSST